MNIGEMNKRIAWKMPVKNRNETGEQYYEWVTSNEVWAEVDSQMSGSDEKEQQGRDTDITTVIFRTYYNQAVHNTWRIVYGSDEYEIINFTTEGNKMFMEIEAKRYETA
jgi:SPP1 family predicted phage head-tail adaptor